MLTKEKKRHKSQQSKSFGDTMEFFFWIYLITNIVREELFEAILLRYFRQ